MVAAESLDGDLVWAQAALKSNKSTMADRGLKEDIQAEAKERGVQDV